MQLTRPSSNYRRKRNTGEMSAESSWLILNPPDHRYLNRFVTDADLLDPANAPVRVSSDPLNDVLVYEVKNLGNELERWGDVDSALRTGFAAKHSADKVDAMLVEVQ